MGGQSCFYTPHSQGIKFKSVLGSSEKLEHNVFHHTLPEISFSKEERHEKLDYWWMCSQTSTGGRQRDSEGGAANLIFISFLLARAVDLVSLKIILIVGRKCTLSDITIKAYTQTRNYPTEKAFDSLSNNLPKKEWWISYSISSELDSFPLFLKIQTSLFILVVTEDEIF